MKITVLALSFASLVAGILHANDAPKHQFLTLTSPWQSFTEMNNAFADRFVSKKGFGFSRMIDLERTKTISIANNPYRIGKIQLIGITEHEKPVLYETHADANRENIKEAKTRLLTAIESNALNAIRSNKEWVMIPKSDDAKYQHRVMIGQLRARQSCLKCHARKALSTFALRA